MLWNYEALKNFPLGSLPSTERGREVMAVHAEKYHVAHHETMNDLRSRLTDAKCATVNYRTLFELQREVSNGLRAQLDELTEVNESYGQMIDAQASDIRVLMETLRESHPDALSRITLAVPQAARREP